VEDLVEAVVIAEGDEDVAVVAAERMKKRNGMQTADNLHRHRILICGVKGSPSQNLAVL
jgi:hypothetical protein